MPIPALCSCMELLVLGLNDFHVGKSDLIEPFSGRVKTGRMIVNPATGCGEPEYTFDHLCWQRIIRLELETEGLMPEENKITQKN